MNPPPAAKKRRLDNSVEVTNEKTSITDDESSRLVVNSFLHHIATSERLLLVQVVMETIESFLRDKGGKRVRPVNDTSLQQDFVDTFLELDGCEIVLRALRRWVDMKNTRTNADDLLDEDTLSLASATLGMFLHMMVYNRRTSSCILEVDGIRITEILLSIYRRAPLDTAILAQVISMWGDLMLNATRRGEALTENFSSLILNMMLLHPECECIQRNGCKFFAQLPSMPQASRETQDFDRSILRQVIQQSLVSYQNKERTAYWVRKCTSLYSAGNLVSDDDCGVASVVQHRSKNRSDRHFKTM